MNFIKKNSKHILMGLTLSFFVLMLGLGLGLSAFGMGMESQRFITSVDKVIDKYIPKGKVVVDGSVEPIEIVPGYTTDLYAMAVELLKESYETDVLSTLTLEEQNDKVLMNFWKDYADTKFDEKWKSKIDNKEDIDINEFSHAVVQFDIEVAKQFHNYAFTHSGLGWIGQKKVLSQLWGSNFANTALYQEAQQNETILDQSEYKAGTYVVNNKVSFINTQITSIITSVNSTDLGLDKIFKDVASVNETLKNDDGTTVQISVDDLYHPNYTKMFQQTRIGAIFLIILTPIFGIIFIASSLVGYSVLLKMNWSRNLLNKMRINKARV